MWIRKILIVAVASCLNMTSFSAHAQSKIGKPQMVSLEDPTTKADCEKEQRIWCNLIVPIDGGPSISAGYKCCQKGEVCKPGPDYNHEWNCYDDQNKSSRVPATKLRK